MCASFVDWKRIRVLAIGCCLAVAAVQSPAMGQLFQRRGNQAGRRQAASRQADESQDSATRSSEANSRVQAPAQPDTSASQEPVAAGTERYQVPKTTDVEELVKYLSNLLTFQPKTKEEAEQYRQRAPQAMTLAAQKILQNETDENSDNYLFAEKYLLAVDVMSVDQATPDEKMELMGIIVKNLQRPEMDADDLDIAVAFTEGLEMSGDKQMAATAYKRFAQVFLSNQDPMLVELGQLMEGSARRLNLVGQTITVQGLTMDGRAFDWSAFKGKVVLIDFWATWCGPCIKEIPTLKKYYEAYHDRGFEIVGVCMNEKREPVDKFFETNAVPWETLFEPNGKTNPTAIYYGISALPTTILVDQQGRVVTLAARGEALGKQLERLLGPAN